MDTVEGMRAFAAVAAQKSFTEGARRVGISTKLASKYVGQLEQRLDAQLFHRTTRSVTLTDTGRAYYERCLPLLEQFDELEGLVQQRQTELAGRIRLTAPTGYGVMHLAPHLYPFQQAHPDVTIDMHLSDHNLSLVDEGFDLALRFGGLQDSSLVARKLTDMRVVCCAAPEYLDRVGTPQTPSELSGHNCLLLALGGGGDHWDFDGPGGTYSVQISGNFRANSPAAIAGMAADGLGVGRVPLYTVQSHVAEGHLRLLLEEHEAPPFGLYAVYPPSRHLSARLRALIDHLAARF